MRINVKAIFIASLVVFLSQFASSSEEVPPIDENLDCITGSNIGMYILKNYKRAVVATYESGDDAVYGLSINPDGKRIKEFNKVPEDDVSDFMILLFDKRNFGIYFGKDKKDQLFNGEKLNWNQGIELSDNNSYVRIYFSQDGRYCKFYTSSGVRSSVWICSDKLAASARAILGQLQANKEPSDDK